MWLTHAPGCMDLLGGPGEHTGSTSLLIPVNRAVYSAIQNREDDQIHIRILGTEQDGGSQEWSGVISDIYTKKGPPRSLAILRELFEESGAPWMMRLMAAMIGLRRTHQLNTPKVGFSLVVWSRLPANGGFNAEVAFATSVSLALKAATGVDIKRVDGVRIARAVVHGAKEVLGEKMPIAGALTCSMGQLGCAMSVEHGVDPIMQWIPLPDHCVIAGVDSGVETPVAAEVRIAAATGAAMGMCYLNNARKKEREPQLGGWGQVTPSQFEGGFRDYVPTKESGKEWARKFRKEKEILENVDKERNYRERALSEHQVRESSRAIRMVAQLGEFGRTKKEDFLAEAGKSMNSSHRSLREKCTIVNPEIDELLGRIQAAGRAAGLFGCRLAESGRHGVVAVLAHSSAEITLREITAEWMEEREGRAMILTGTGLGGSLTGWWEGIFNPKKEKADGDEGGERS